MTEPLRTERLTLRLLRADDAPALHACFSDPEVMRYFDVPHARLEQTQAWVDGTVSAPADRTREYALVDSGTVIGKAGIWRRPELGFLLRRDRWRQGLMREALTALLPHVSELMGLDRVTADVDTRNAPCIALLTGLGFVETHRAERTVRIGDTWTDSVYFEWRA